MSFQAPQPNDELYVLVNEIYDNTVAEARERVWSHRFTRDLEAGTLPMEVIRGLMLNLSTWAMEINATSRRKFGRNADFYAHHPDLEELLSDKAADEFTTPTPPGHQPTVYRLGTALGLTREQMIHYPLLPATRGYLDSICWHFETGGPGGIAPTEEWYADWAKTWSQALRKHYGLTREDVFYWDLHAEADSLEEHTATTVEREVMGHGMANRYLAWRVLQAGMGMTPDFKERWTRITKKTVEQFLIWLDQVYDTYDPRRPDHVPINGYQPPRKVRPSGAERAVGTFLKRGRALAEKRILKHPFVRALERGQLSRGAVASFHEQWSRVARRITASYVGHYQHFIHFYKLNPDLEIQVTSRIGNEVEHPVKGGRPRTLDPLLEALGSSREIALKADLFIETDFLIAFLGRLFLEATFAETSALQLGNVIAPFARLCRESLSKNYGVSPEACLYWDTYAKHDTAETGGGALGTVAENRTALFAIYERGLVTERPGWGVNYVGETSIRLWEMFLDGCKRHLMA